MASRLKQDPSPTSQVLENANGNKRLFFFFNAHHTYWGLGKQLSSLLTGASTNMVFCRIYKNLAVSIKKCKYPQSSGFALKTGSIENLTCEERCVNKEAYIIFLVMRSYWKSPISWGEGTGNQQPLYQYYMTRKKVSLRVKLKFPRC